MKEKLILFAEQQNLEIINEREVQGGTQFCIKDESHKIYCTFYKTGTVLIQGPDVGLKSLLSTWAGKNSPDYKKEPGAVLGWADLPAGWREWNEEADWLKKYIEKKGLPDENIAPRRYKINREVMFHDYMFRNRQMSEIEFKTLKFVLLNWFTRFCFMGLKTEAFIEDVINYCISSYSECRKNQSVSLAGAAEAISMFLCEHCPRFFIKLEGAFVCPQTKTDQNMCVCRIVDALYPYSSAHEVLAYTKTNFNKLLKRNYELKWYSMKPSTPIEERMAKGLETAGLLSIPQFQAHDDKHKYKIDFVIKTSKGPHIAVECDGLEFHARADTYIHDRIRDRYIQHRGFFVMRFSSIEIFNNLDSCLLELDETFWKIQKGKLSMHEPPRINYFGLDD
jgi:very-short-patch-repair endonuclease